MRQHRHMTRQRRQTVLQQRRQRMIAIRRMPLTAQNRQQHISDARQRQTTAAIRTATQIDEMQSAAASLHDARIATTLVAGLTGLPPLQTVLVHVQREDQRRIEDAAARSAAAAFRKRRIEVEGGSFGGGRLQFGGTAQVVVAQIAAGRFVGLCTESLEDIGNR